MHIDLRLPEKIRFLDGGSRNWYDVSRRCIVRAATAFVAYGCPDWGNPGGVRNRTCTFCPLPQAAEAYRQEFYGTESIADHAEVFDATLRKIMAEEPYDTLNIFNAGSFLAMPGDVQEGILRSVVRYPLRRLVIESRGSLITKERIEPVVRLLHTRGIALTVRIGVESQDDNLRLRVLKKGHTRAQLRSAVDVMHEYGVSAGAYVLLNPAPGLDPAWAENEALRTFDWVLGDLRMDEAYLGPTCVGPATSLATEWHAGRFSPPSLWAVYRVLTKALATHGNRVHLLRFSDEPPFIAVPSNHVLRGIPESLDGALGCDLEFHAMFERYRSTMDPSTLYAITCSCAP